MRRSRNQSGFALLMALMLVLLAGAALAGVARRNVVVALEARDSVEGLQRRWAVETCRATLLPRAASILEEAEGGKPPAHPGAGPRAARAVVAEWRVRCRLAEHDIELIFTDEQAKLNTNHLLNRTSRAEAQAALNRLVAGRTDQRAIVNLRPLPGSGDSGRRLGSLGQVFENATPQELLGDARTPGLAGSITCWGDGRLHLRRAPAALVHLMCDKPLGVDLVSAILAARDRQPARELEATLGELVTFDPQRLGKAAAMIADRSLCHGIWIVARNKQRARYAFSVGTTNEIAESSEPKEKLDWRLDFDW